MINEFHNENRYSNFLDETELKKNLKFKGVQVIRNKRGGEIYEVSSHGNFAKDKNKIIKPNFNAAWKPTERWTPYLMSLEHRYIAFGWDYSKSAQIYNEVVRGIDTEKLSPKVKVYNHFLKIHKEKKKKHPDNRDDNNKRKSLSLIHI